MTLFVLIAATTALPLDITRTIYHVNPLRFGPIPRDTDTADPVGDLFFEMQQVLNFPLECTDESIPPEKRPFNCRNLEVDSTDVLNKITVDMNSNFSLYARCNIGNENGTDPFGRPCPVNDYCCYCDTPEFDQHTHQPISLPCEATVGLEDVYDTHGPGNNHTPGPCFKDYQCWQSRCGYKLKPTPNLRGSWFSTLDVGDCSQHPLGPNCTWRVRSVDKVVNSSCHTKSFFNAIRRAAPEPFVNCSVRVNASDPCWARGFYEAVLGPDSGTPCTTKSVPYYPYHVYNCTYAIGGIPLDDVVKMWTAPFESDREIDGGCPGLPIPPKATDDITAQMRAKLHERMRSGSRAV